MRNTNLVDPHLEARKLLTMSTREAEALFQSYPMEQQLEIISSISDARDREELYYLVPDCTELIQRSAAEDVLQVLNTMLGTGLASVLLPCLSSEQFEEIMDLAIWRNGKLDEKALNLWLFELAECERDELAALLSQVDIGVLANLLRDRMKMGGDFRALFIEAGMVDPLKSGIKYADERAEGIVVAIWEADAELFVHLLYEIFGLDKEEDEAMELEATLERAKEQRDERVQQRDKAAGINITDEEVLQRVNLDNLELDDDEKDASN